jgi:hypothetical protein
VPLEPLPPDWEEGAALEIAPASPSLLDIDVWAMSMNQLCADSSSDEEQVMRSAVEQHQRQAKEQVRRDMGLPG